MEFLLQLCTFVRNNEAALIFQGCFQSYSVMVKFSCAAAMPSK